MVDVDITRWIEGLRAANPIEYEDAHASFAERTRATIVQGVVTDALTAVFLLNGASVSSDVGRGLVLRFAKLFANYDPVSMSLALPVQLLVPKLHAICQSLSPANLKKVVQKVMELSLKPRASVDWVKKTITNLVGLMRAVTNTNCERFLTELTCAAVPIRVLKVRNHKTEATIVELSEAKDDKVCINRPIVCEHVCGFSCVRAEEFQKVKKIH